MTSNRPDEFSADKPRVLKNPHEMLGPTSLGPVNPHRGMDDGSHPEGRCRRR